MESVSAPPPALWDRLGIGVSALCLVHCLALPFILTGLSVWVVAEAMHVGLALVAVPVAALAGWRGYRTHRHVAVPLLLGAGAAALVGAIAFDAALGAAGHIALTVLGGMLLIGAHTVNWRLRVRCA